MSRPVNPGRLILAVIILFPFSGFLQAQKPHIGGAPSWVSNPRIDYGLSGSLTDIEDGILGIALEKQIDLGSQTLYCKKVLKIVTDAGVQNGSSVSITYDPAYQRLVFHHICIIRGGKTIDKLDLSKIRTIRKETDLDRSIYNGSLTSMLFLEDTRKGDVIEYDYSLQGFNPVFRGKYSADLSMEFSVPLGSLLYRIICPAGRVLTLKNINTTLSPVISVSGGNRIYEWRREKIGALKAQDHLPDWYEPYGRVMVSEYQSWNEVAKWALSLFSTGAPSGALRDRIDEILKDGSDPEKKLLAALHFVQDEIRYLGIEMGVNSHKPNEPAKVFTQRFGDCKDKSFLLCTMLRAMGIESAPVLINTESKKALYDWLPSPLDFNHCTVRVRLGGRTYWLDPTISLQRGGIDAISFPNYQCGLVLTDTCSGLSSIPLQDSGQVFSKESFSMKDLSGPASMEVTTRYTGSFADELRNDINSNSLSELQQNYLNFYGDYYKEIRVSDSLAIEDNERTGMLTIREYYTLDKLWEHRDGLYKASFYGLQVSALLEKEKPNERDRKMPVGISFPGHLIEEIEVNLPEEWNFDVDPTRVSCSGFQFHSIASSGPRRVSLRYDYQALQDYIPVGDCPQFFQDYDKIKEALGYELTKKEVSTAPDYRIPAGNSNTMGNLVKLLVCILLIILIVNRVRRR